jgi:SAM-dependent methyltransferase
LLTEDTTARESLWDGHTYDDEFRHVIDAGSDLLDVLRPEPGEHVLDLGCGTGTLTAAIAARGAHVTGIDVEPAMVDQARTRYPELDFMVGDGHRVTAGAPLDAVFANAVLHWLTRADEALASVHRTLRPGGRLVAEMTVEGSLTTLVELLDRAVADLGLPPARPFPWYHPDVDSYLDRVREAGFRIADATTFERHAWLPAGMSAGAWWARFGGGVLSRYGPADSRAVLDHVDRHAVAPVRREAVWLRFVAVRVG